MKRIEVYLLLFLGFSLIGQSQELSLTPHAMSEIGGSYYLYHYQTREVDKRNMVLLAKYHITWVEEYLVKVDDKEYDLLRRYRELIGNQIIKSKRHLSIDLNRSIFESYKYDSHNRLIERISSPSAYWYTYEQGVLKKMIVGRVNDEGVIIDSLKSYTKFFYRDKNLVRMESYSKNQTWDDQNI